MIRISSINIAALIIILIATTAAFFALSRKMRVVNKSKDFTIPVAIPTTGIEIPVLVTYSGPKGLALLNFSQNHINPRLVLYEDRMEYKVLARKAVNYSQIEYIRVLASPFFYRIQFAFYDRNTTFSPHLANREIVECLVDFFRARGIPVNN